MDKAEKEIVCFDLDRTLIGAISGNALIRTAWQKGMIRFPDIVKASVLYLQYRIHVRDPLETISRMTGWLKGKSITELDDLCEKTFSEILYPSLYSQAAEEIASHRSAGRKIILLSSAIDKICQLVSDATGIDGFLCSNLECADGFYTGKPEGLICYGEEKLNRLTRYCQINDLPLQNVWFYSDSISDLPVLCSAGTPVCVNPDRKLKKEALRRGWKILDWSN